MRDGCRWRKVYENRADGTTFSGDLGDFVDAIKSGADVQIRYFFHSPSPLQGEWHRTCSSVTFVEDEDSGGAGPQIVSCMVTDISDTQVDLTQGRVFARPPAFEWQAYNTSGVRHSLKFDRKTLNVESDTSDNLQIAWYVRG